MGSQRVNMAMIGAKGGACTTTTVLLAAQKLRYEVEPTVLVDLTGDLGVVIGTAPDLPGIAEVLEDGPDVSPVRSQLIDVAPNVRLLPHGTGRIPDDLDESWMDMWGQLRDTAANVLIDAGRGPDALERIAHSNARRVMVMTCCYQALHRARDVVAEVDDVVVVTDTQRALGLADIEAALGRHADAAIAMDRSISRWADAGLLLDRTSKATQSLHDLVAGAGRSAPRSRGGLSVS